METWKSVPSTATLDGFWRAASVLVNKPHVANRRLCGAKLLTVKQSEDNLDTICHTFSDYEPLIEENEALIQLIDVDLTTFDQKRHIILRDLLPKNVEKYPTLREVVVFDPLENRVYFKPVCYRNQEQKTSDKGAGRDIDDEISYCFKFNAGEQRIYLGMFGAKDRGEEVRGQVSATWLTKTLLPKLASWAAMDQLRTSVTSLRLVPIDQYNTLYNQLKLKYGQELVKVWPEKTDPQKYVYEDVAIAAYLLLLWKEERERKQTEELQSFVDLGCGNGLLVYILSSEGHQGVGIDIRKRNIWDMYGPNTILKVMAITPSADTVFPEYDWIIGNHSDELTPWIPVMAARSSYSCNYFLLPCCPHDFHGRFSQRGSNGSQYRGYLDFVVELGRVFGFSVEEDTLRIPSTKRVCFIGRSRNYAQSDEQSVDLKRTIYINNRPNSAAGESKAPNIYSNFKRQCSMDSGYSSIGSSQESSGSNSPTESREVWDSSEESADRDGSDVPTVQVTEAGGGKVWSAKFQVRSGVEGARNCQSVPKNTQEKIVGEVFQQVLEAADAETLQVEGNRSWRRGGSIALGEVAQLFDQDVLQQLKSECGGLQTLLRNHNHIFQVSGGRVRLRDLSCANPWGKRSEAKRRKVDLSDRLKTTACWFHDNHPDGCPRPASVCTFAHGEEELRPRPPPSKSGSKF